MKKVISLLLITAFLLSFSGILTNTSKALVASEKVNGLSLEADTYSVILGETKRVTFTARANASHKLSSISLCDDSRNILANLHDDGKDGDATASDGLYSATVELTGDSLCTVKFHAEYNGIKSPDCSVKYRRDVKNSDYQVAQDIWDDIEAFENELSARSLTSEGIANAVYDMLKRVHSDKIADMKHNNAKSFSFTLNSGIENYFEHFEFNNSYESNLPEQIKSLSYINKGSVGVWCPFYGLENDFTKSYMERAEEMDKIAHFDGIDAYYAGDASVNSFKNFDKYGIVMIDSHGADHNGGGYVLIPRPGEYDRQDIADGHLVLSGGMMLLGGSFIQKYCKTLPNTIVYTGICYGLAADNFYAPLLNHGAAFVAGFDEAVSFTFDGIIMNDFCQRLVEPNPKTHAQYTAGDAYKACIALNGEYDKYTNVHARFLYYGNGETVASAVAIPVENATISPTELTLYHNNTYALSLNICPSNANRYTQKWTSSRPDIVTVDEYGNITAKQTDGTAEITCVVTDTSGQSPKEYIAKSTITVDGKMPVSGIAIIQHTMTLYAGTETGAQIRAHVLPENASDQQLIYTVHNSDIATVDKEGNVMPKNAGTTYITVTTHEGSFCENVVVNVVEGNLDSALNKANGTLSFATGTSKYPAEAITHDGRYCAATTNINQMNSNSYMTLSAGFLPAGTELVFDWAVSSEAVYDEFRFMVNSVTQSAISGTRLWDTFTYTIPTDGEYTFRWVYVKDYATNIDDDRGYLDEVDIIIPDKTHTVTFTDFDGSTIEEQAIEHGGSAKAPTPPTHDGFIFIGWDTDFTNVRSDITVSAIYDMGENACIVIFIGMQGQHLGTTTVLRGNSVTPPEPPQEEGYTFLKWSADLSCVMQNMEVHALYGISGDANSDGKLNTGDAACVLRYMAEMLTLTDEQKLLADFNRDGNVNTGDATAILKWLVANV